MGFVRNNDVLYDGLFFWEGQGAVFAHMEISKLGDL